jgi:mannose-6-phosphate isomerase-like protein (cupin superfamily)
MARVGQTITNPQTGEQITFRRLSEEVLELDFVVAPGGAPASAHVHPKQVERFAVHSGLLHITVGGKERSHGPGGQAIVPPGAPHIWHAAGGEELRMTITFEPALGAARFFEQFFELANAGRTKPDGTMRLLDAAVVLDESRDFLYLPKPPVAVQKALFRVLAPVGRLLRRGTLQEVPETAADAKAAMS